MSDHLAPLSIALMYVREGEIEIMKRIAAKGEPGGVAVDAYIEQSSGEPALNILVGDSHDIATKAIGGVGIRVTSDAQVSRLRTLFNEGLDKLALLVATHHKEDLN